MSTYNNVHMACLKHEITGLGLGAGKCSMYRSAATVLSFVCIFHNFLTIGQLETFHVMH